VQEASYPDDRAEPPLLLETAGNKGHILIVDDNPVNQLVALRAVRGLGYSGEAVEGAYEALEALHTRRFDLVLMDCQMPGMDGYEATAEIRRLEALAGSHTRTPVVAMTANAIEGDRERCIAAGMDDYLAKPVRLVPLAGALERWVRREPQLLVPQSDGGVHP
jgi:CheY-like chemotaxis protein